MKKRRKHQAPTLMIQGTASYVGKSTLVAGLCRLLTRRGYRVLPFKAQNIALNSAVTPDGGEIGRSQALQARACGTKPRVEMNPLLLKPSAGGLCHILLLGQPFATIPWSEYPLYQRCLLPLVRASLERLRKEADLVILEGAGSPAEPNLMEQDLPNHLSAEMAEAPVLLVGDIDRGGVFASLYGTLALLPSPYRQRIKGFLINRFRGDPSLLEPALRFLKQKTGRPILGVIPYLPGLHLEEEDTTALEESPYPSSSAKIDIKVLHLPHLSNSTDFRPLQVCPEVRLTYVEAPWQIEHPDLVILPGSRNTLWDLKWLLAQGFGEVLRRYASHGGRILGICGGYQMLGIEVKDPEGVEGPPSSYPGLGFLPLKTVFERRKILSQTTAVSQLPGSEGLKVKGYEIHHGRTEVLGEAKPAFWVTHRLGLTASEPEGVQKKEGRIFGTYLHGLFDSQPFCYRFLKQIAQEKGCLLSSPPPESEVEGQLERLADALEETIEIDRILCIAGLK